MKPSRTQQEALSDLADGRVIEQRSGDWGGVMAPMDIAGMGRRTPLGRVKTVTIEALERRGWIDQDEGVTFDAYYQRGQPKVYRITDLGSRAIGRFDDKRGL